MVTPVPKDLNGTSNPISLEPYEEIIGHLKAISRDDHYLEMKLSAGRLRFPSESNAAEICWSELSDKEGLKVSILRIPDQATPLAINVVESGNLPCE